MRLRLGYKLFLTVLATCLISISLMIGVMRYFVKHDFENFMHNLEMERMTEITEKLANIYQKDKSWQALSKDPLIFQHLLRPELPRSASPPPMLPPGLPDFHPHGVNRPPLPGMPAAMKGNQQMPPRGEMEQRMALYDAGHRFVTGNPATGPDQIVRPVLIAGRSVGYVHLKKRPALATPLERDFVYRQTRTFLLTGCGVLLMAALAAYLLASHLLNPVQQLARGAHALAARKFDTRIHVTSLDELGQLADDFNRMAQTLERYEHLRRQWLSDIAHELRTPLAVLKGEIEAMQDGVREMNARNLKSLHVEVALLEKLVRDLHELSVADTQGLSTVLESVDVIAVMQDSLALFAPRIELSGLRIVNELAPGAPLVMADKNRLAQVFANLFENSIRYTQSPGILKVWAEIEKQCVRLNVEDSPPGVPEEALEKLFERLYRVDPARSRTSGGSGLGLAICKSLVESWGGTIRAMHSSLGGLRIEISLPRARQEV